MCVHVMCVMCGSCDAMYCYVMCLCVMCCDQGLATQDRGLATGGEGMLYGVHHDALLLPSNRLQLTWLYTCPLEQAPVMSK